MPRREYPGEEEYRKLFAKYVERDEQKKTRIQKLKERTRTFSDPDDFMLVILELFNEREFIPQPGKYYTFVYQAKTPKIVYDEHPLIACLSLQKWGFTGLNFHFPMVRNYTWNEVVGQMHIVNNDEIDYMKSVPYQKMITK